MTIPCRIQKETYDRILRCPGCGEGGLIARTLTEERCAEKCLRLPTKREPMSISQMRLAMSLEFGITCFHMRKRNSWKPTTTRTAGA